MGDLLLQDLNNLVATALGAVEFLDGTLVLLFDGCELLQGPFEHIRQLQGLCFVLVLILLHTEL